MFVTLAEMQGLALPCSMLGHEPPFLILDWSPAHHCFIFIKHTCQFLVFSPSLPFFFFFWVASQMVMPQKGISEELQHLSHAFLSAHAAAVTINAYHKTASLRIRVGKGIPGNYSHSLCWGRYMSTWSGFIQPRTLLVLFCSTIMAQDRGEQGRNTFS